MTSGPSLRLTARHNPSAVGARRGIVHVHPEVLIALGLREWDAVSIIGARVTAAVVAATDPDAPTGTVLLDELTLVNAGVREDASVVLSPAVVAGAARITVSGSALATAGLDAPTLRRALLGKVCSVGDVVSLLPRDLGPDLTAGPTTAALARSVGITWTAELLTVTATDPGSPVSVQPGTAVVWSSATALTLDADPATRTSAIHEIATPVTAQQKSTAPTPAGTATTRAPAASPANPRRTVGDLIGVDAPVTRLREWLTITLDEPDILRTLGATPRLGVLVTGPVGIGKSTIVRAVCADRRLRIVDGPVAGAMEATARLRAVTDAVAGLAADGGGVLMIVDAQALLPARPEPVASLILDALSAMLDHGACALIATTSDVSAVDPRLREPLWCDRELRIPAPDAATRAGILSAICRDAPTDGDLDLPDIGARTPGFVAGDLAALAREAALRAAARARDTDTPPTLTHDDLSGALSVTRPRSRVGSPEFSPGSLTLDDVGDMVETKQALTEAVLWPLQHPDTFTRLGVAPPRGVLLYGPPGCGKTFLVRALAATGRLSVHTVKGAELLDKWVGSSERAVRDLFERARGSAPSLVFLDEVDALAPRRGQSSDSGVADRVVAALLTELDGAQPLQDVVVLAATNRPELIDPALVRPGRLERSVFVPPPDADARADILRTAARGVPLASDVDLDALAADLDGYSAADCTALLREAALAAMRRDIDAATIAVADITDARTRVRPSLDAAQVAQLRAYAAER